MQIKRFEAKNMTEALRQIKRELGAEAVILSAKDIRKENRLLGIARKIGVEVTAAVDGVQPAQASPMGRRLGIRGKTTSEGGTSAAPTTGPGRLGSEVQDVVRLGDRRYPKGRVGAGPLEGAAAPSRPPTVNQA